jgi:hypothetical protein
LLRAARGDTRVVVAICSQGHTPRLSYYHFREKSMWEPREKALAATNSQLRNEAQFLDTGFRLLDRAIERLTRTSEEDNYISVAVVILIKAKHLALASYSLALDALGQEAGALARVWIEALELLRYLALDTSRVQEVFEERLPSPGAIGKKIDGQAQGLRNLFNESASHFRFDVRSILHIANPDTRAIRTVPEFKLNVFKANVTVVYWFLHFTLVEAIIAMGAAGIPNQDLAELVDDLKSIAQDVFPVPYAEVDPAPSIGTP